MVCAQPFDSFDESQLGAFVESPLGVRDTEPGDKLLILYVFTSASSLHCVYLNNLDLFNDHLDEWRWVDSPRNTIRWPSKEKRAVRGVYSWHHDNFPGHDCPFVPPGGSTTLPRNWMVFPFNASRDSGSVSLSRFSDSTIGQEFDAFATDGITGNIHVNVIEMCVVDTPGSCLSGSELSAKERQWADYMRDTYPDLNVTSQRGAFQIAYWVAVTGGIIGWAAHSNTAVFRD